MLPGSYLLPGSEEEVLPGRRFPEAQEELLPGSHLLPNSLRRGRCTSYTSHPDPDARQEAHRQKAGWRLKTYEVMTNFT
jgi:hypothetical protein